MRKWLNEKEGSDRPCLFKVLAANDFEVAHSHLGAECVGKEVRRWGCFHPSWLFLAVSQPVPDEEARSPLLIDNDT